MNTGTETGPRRHRGAAALACGGNARPARHAARGNRARRRPRARPPLRTGARRTRADHPSQRDSGRAVAACHAGAVRQDRCRTGAPCGRIAKSRRTHPGVFHRAVAAHARLVGERGSTRHRAASRIDRRHPDQAAERAATRRHRCRRMSPPTVPLPWSVSSRRPAAADITAFLETNKLSIAGGPSAGGLYRVRIAAAKTPKPDSTAS